MSCKISFFGSGGFPFIQKVVPVSAEEIEHISRWNSDQEYCGGELRKGREDSLLAAVTLRLDRKVHRKRCFTELDGQSGWLVFELLEIVTPPTANYLLYSAVTFLGDWVDGLVLEKLFGYVRSVGPANSPSPELANRVKAGLDAHRQLSLAHWWHRRKFLVAELEGEFGDRYESQVTKIEQRLKRSGRRSGVPLSQMDKSLVEARESLRKSLLEAEATEGEVASFLIRLHNQEPACTCRKLFALEWSVEMPDKPPR